MTEPSVAIEWQYDEQEYSYIWCGSRGKNWPILPVGSEIKMEKEGILWRLKVNAIDARVTRFNKDGGDALYIYIKCKVLGTEL